MYDIVIIGAGVVGCAIARELSKYNCKVCLLEKNEDVATEATKANSGIVHSGYSDKPGSLKARFCVKGNSMYQQLDNELHFGFKKIGALIIGFDTKDAAKLQQLYETGIKNGVPGLEIVEQNFIRQQEPHLNPDIKLALYSPSVGIISGYEFAIALAENAITNGVTLKLNSEVIALRKDDDRFTITTNQEILNAKTVINAAGVYSDDIAQMLGVGDFKISPRQGQYLLFDKDQGHLVKHVIFQTPTEISKGILVTNTLHGNLLIGPDATPAPAKNYVETSGKNITQIIATAKKSLPNFDLRKVITSFAGNRAVPNTGDFIIGETKVPGFINVAGIESPGLTAAPAIAEYIAELLADKMELTTNPHFNPERPPYNTVATMNPNELNELIKKDPAYGTIICRCETVSEGEIRDCLRRPIPVNSIDAIKRRTRVSMGRCQGGFCTPKIMEIIEDELQMPREKITKKGGKSLLVLGRTKAGLRSVD